MRKSSSAVRPAKPFGASETDEFGIADLLKQLGSADAQAAWEEFLLRYSSILYQTVHASTRDQDEIADCFVHICKHLARNGFRRLLRFSPDGAASFTTWLRVVARNLCFDWHRKVHGRFRPFKSVQGLSALELEVYQCRYERRLSREETLARLHVNQASLNEEELTDIENRIENSLTPLQHWILSSRKESNLPTTAKLAEDEEPGHIDVPDEAPSPEAVALEGQQRTRLHECLESLPPDERLVVRLRFEDELSLDEISKLTGLGDAQRVHRRLAAILGKLRAAMERRNDRKTAKRVREISQETNK